MIRHPYRPATQAERTTIREFVAGVSELITALTVLPVVLLIVAMTRRTRFMENAEECGNCREPWLRCRCQRSDA